jgi:hypothetical protein
MAWYRLPRAVNRCIGGLLAGDSLLSPFGLNAPYPFSTQSLTSITKRQLYSPFPSRQSFGTLFPSLDEYRLGRKIKLLLGGSQSIFRPVMATSSKRRRRIPTALVLER